MKRTQNRVATALAAAALVTVAGCAAPRADSFHDTFAALDAAVNECLETERVPGAVVTLGVRNGRGFLSETRAYGKLSLEPDAPDMPIDAIFDLASLTKPVATGTSLMMLVEEGRVDLDAPVNDYLRNARVACTVRQLMTHESGLPPYLTAQQRESLIAENGFPCRSATRGLIRTLAPASAPGEKTTYSCLNAILCAEIVESAGGLPLETFAARRIFQPLGMRDTAFTVPLEKRSRAAPTTRAAWAPEGEYLRGHVHDPIAALQGGVSGNAGLFSTAADLSRFAECLLDGGRIGDVRILQPETVAAMTRPATTARESRRAGRTARGLLWEVHPPAQDAPTAQRLGSFGHTGYTGVSLLLFPDAGAYLVLLTNRVHPDDSASVDGLRHAGWRLMCDMLARGKEPDAPRAAAPASGRDG